MRAALFELKNRMNPTLIIFVIFSILTIILEKEKKLDLKHKWNMTKITILNIRLMKFPIIYNRERKQEKIYKIPDEEVY